MPRQGRIPDRSAPPAGCRRRPAVGFLSLLLVCGACEQARPPREPAVAAPASEPPALLLLAERGDLPALEALLLQRKAPDVIDGCRWTPLMKAAQHGHLATARRLLEAGADPNRRDQGGYTALMLAAANGHAALTALLLEWGAASERRDRTLGWTALIWAAKEGRAETVEILLAHGADPDARDFAGRRARDWARRNGHSEVASRLSIFP